MRKESSKHLLRHCLNKYTKTKRNETKRNKRNKRKISNSV